MSGQIVLAATPIGNLGDATQRLRDHLATADVVAAEDTRTARHLARALGLEITGRVVALHDHNERDKAADLVSQAAGGARVLLVSDAGMPTVSDPGFRVVQAAAAAGVSVTVLPGPSAVLAALAVSGLPTDRFCFEGFVPRKAGERLALLEALATEVRTMVFFESPHRVAATLEAMTQVWGEDRPAAVSRELTKAFEETQRGTLGELSAWAGAHAIKGEIVVTVAGRQSGAPSMESLVAEAMERIGAGERSSAVVSELAATSKVAKRELYARVLEAKGDTQ